MQKKSDHISVWKGASGKKIMGYSIAIDGPAGAGKSSVAKEIAKRLNYIYVDTGAMYRAMALFFIRNNVAPEQKEEIEKFCEKADITIEYQKGEQVVLLLGENVNRLIRTEEVGNMASATSSNEKVREKLVSLQRKLAARSEVVMDGRDIGTCVLPDANVKIYLTASSRVRAERRYLELCNKKEECNLEKIEADIIERDRRDMTREISPLKQAKDAHLVDSSHMSLEEVINRILSIVREDQGV